MDTVKIIKDAQIRAGLMPTGLRGGIDFRVLPFIMEEVWKECAKKGMCVLDWKEQILRVVGFRKYALYLPYFDDFIIERVHSEDCFIYDREMYVDDQELYKD